jgi:hypothetical protein
LCATSIGATYQASPAPPRDDAHHDAPLVDDRPAQRARVGVAGDGDPVEGGAGGADVALGRSDGPAPSAVVAGGAAGVGGQHERLLAGRELGRAREHAGRVALALQVEHRQAGRRVGGQHPGADAGAVGEAERRDRADRDQRGAGEHDAVVAHDDARAAGGAGARPCGLDAHHRGRHPLAQAVEGIGVVEAGQRGVERDTLGDGSFDDPLADAEGDHATARQHRPQGARRRVRPPGAAAPGRGIGRGGGDERGCGRAERDDRVGVHLGRMAPEPVVGVWRRTEPRVVRFGVVVEGHGRRLTVCGRRRAAPTRGERPAAAPGDRLPYDPTGGHAAP